MLTYLEEEDDLQAEGGGKLRKSILTGTNSPACMAAVRAMEVLCDTVLWPLLRAVKPSADKHTLDVLPVLWPKAVEFFRDAASRPRGMIDGLLRMDTGDSAAAATHTEAQMRRSERAAVDMKRIRETIQGDQQMGDLVDRLFSAACTAMAAATENHASEWLGPDGKLCAAKITPELRAKYDALPTTSTSVERFHSFGRDCDAQGRYAASRYSCWIVPGSL